MFTSSFIDASEGKIARFTLKNSSSRVPSKISPGLGSDSINFPRVTVFTPKNSRLPTRYCACWSILTTMSMDSWASSILDVATGHAALFQIALVILFGGIEFAGGSDFRRDRALEFLAGFKIGPGFFRCGFLLRRMRENRGAVLFAEVGPLAVHLCWIVQLPEDVDQRFVLHFFRIEFDLDHFGVA